MSLSSAFTIISSSFAANAAQQAVVARNIANANTPGYSRETANVSTTAYGGAEVVSILRQTNAALSEQALDSGSQAAGQQAIADGLSRLAATVSDSASATSVSGAGQNGNSPAARLGAFQNALVALEATPNSAAAAGAAVTAAGQLAASLNSASATVQAVRADADAGMASSVASINSLLQKFQTANDAVVSGLHAGADVSAAADTRDSILSQLSQQIGVSSVAGPNGSMSIYTDSGVTLFQTTPRNVSFSTTPSLTAGASGQAVSVDGVPITGPNATMPIHSGALAGLATLRDSLAPAYQAQLDQMAGGLVGAFAESDQSATPTKPTLPGLFTFPGAIGVPAANSATGLAATITVNPNADPAQGGDPMRLRDGGVSAPGNPAYVYNPTGAAGFTGRIQQLVAGIGAARAFDPSAGLKASGSLADYASASVSWLQGKTQSAANASSYQNALATQATSALSNATGVNLDAEMTTMLNLENSYTSSAKLLTTVNAMFSALLNAA